jgi:hypothetical protein
VISSIKPLLSSHYKLFFSEGIKARVWSETYRFSRSDKLKVINSAYENGIITKHDLRRYLYIYRVYNVFKRIPLIRGFYYRLFIEPNFKGYEFWKTERIEGNIKQELLKKVEKLKIDNTFRKQIEIVLKN